MRHHVAVLPGRLLALLVALLTGTLGTSAPARALPPIKHVFVIVLENEDAATSFGPSAPSPYLAKTLPAMGAFVPNYYGIGHASLDNYIAMVSGQAPNPLTQADCIFYTDFLPGTIGADGQAMGAGCVYPPAVKTVADQLAAKGLAWKGYMEDMGADPGRDGGATCAHPKVNSLDSSQTASPKDQYAARHDPFVYFHSIIDSPSCATNVVSLDALPGDLQATESTANYTFITPDLCSDGHDAKCADGGPGGFDAINAFLSKWVPQITASPAFKADGLLAVIFDEGAGDSSACCGEQSGPNTPAAGGQSGGPGGGRTGAVLVSPFIAPGSTTTAAYNHYGLLRTVEDVFGLDHLGYAAAAGVKPFGSDVLSETAAPLSPAGKKPRKRYRRHHHRHHRHRARPG